MLLRIKHVLFLCLLTLTGASCASSYHPIHPASLQYAMQATDDHVEIGYQHRVLKLRDNKRYAKKADKREIAIVAVKISNNSNLPIRLDRHALFFEGESLITLADPVLVTKKIKQNTYWYLFYGLLWLNIESTDGNGHVERGSYPVGVLIGAGNMLVAAKANAQFRNEFTRYNIVNKLVAPGESVTGLLAIKNPQFTRLSLKIKWDEVFSDAELNRLEN